MFRRLAVAQGVCPCHRIEATDAVASPAMVWDTGIAGCLRLLAESEITLNVGTSAVFFAIALSWAQVADVEPVTAATVAQSLALTVGMEYCRDNLRRAAVLLAGHTADHLLETALTIAATCGSFLLAERRHASGVLVAVTYSECDEVLQLPKLTIISRVNRTAPNSQKLLFRGTR